MWKKIVKNISEKAAREFLDVRIAQAIADSGVELEQGLDWSRYDGFQSNWSAGKIEEGLALRTGSAAYSWLCKLKGEFPVAVRMAGLLEEAASV